jgi:hypothetical protein
MRLAAQRVVSPGGRQGVNAFCYLHGPHVWLDTPPPEIASHPGHLVESRIEVKPPGNRVRSYLEILAPDDTPSRAILEKALDIVGLLENRPLPLQVQSGEVGFEFNAELGLAAPWRYEFDVLLKRALDTRPIG